MGLLMGLMAAVGLRAGAAEVTTAAGAVNAFGVDLLGKAEAGNALLSPYSIQAALAMTYAGAAEGTRAEMARVLHYPADDDALHGAFAVLQAALAEVERTTAARASNAQRWGGPSEPITLAVANRLFGQQGYEFRESFLGLVRDRYGAPFQPMDFAKQAEAARVEINGWVERQTRERIRDLIPPGGLDRSTRLALVNAVYLKAPWQEEFPARATAAKPFHVAGRAPVEVPTMQRRGQLGYQQREGFRVVTVPYSGGEVQFVVLLPDAVDGLPALEKKLTPEMLASCARTPAAQVDLALPKFRMEPPLMRLGAMLRDLGMPQAFDRPRGSANFDRMAPRRPDDYLFISEVYHKTFLALDEKGTEAAAATAVVMMRAASAVKPEQPVVCKVDRPFLFAIQHVPSGACLFLGRVTDPR